MNLSFDCESLLQFAKKSLQAVGVGPEIAETTAASLVTASLRGTDSHGIRLLPHYVRGVKGGRINGSPNFTLEKTFSGCATLDADHGFGAAAGVEAMRQSVELARKSGCAFVAVKNSSHCGAMAFYSLRAAIQGMIGLSFTHATPKMRSEGGVRPFFGTNPLCMAAPMAGEDPFCFDSAPTPFSNNKVKQFGEEGIPLPRGAAADADGVETMDANLATQLLPIGGYKGFGLTMVVDILCGLLTGMPSGDEVSTMYGNSYSQKRHLGQLFGAINIEAFEDLDRFKSRLKTMVDKLRGEPRMSLATPVMAPGDPEKKTSELRKVKGIPLAAWEIEKLDAVGDELDVAFPSPLAGSS